MSGPERAAAGEAGETVRGAYALLSKPKKWIKTDNNSKVEHQQQACA